MSDVLLDPVLAPLLAPLDDAQRERVLADLLAVHADPVIQRSLLHRLGGLRQADIDDVRGTVILRLVRKLGDLRDAEPIASFPDYVATVTFHAVDDYLRARQPRRTLLANRLRYLLTHNARFALWMKQRELVCGLARSSGEDAVPMRAEVDVDEKRAVASLLALFTRAGGPLLFHDVVTQFATAAGIGELTTPLESIDPPDAAPSVLTVLEAKETLGRLWSEVQALPVRQRVALLLNLREANGQSATPLVTLTGTADVPALARLLEMEPESLAKLWDDLPLDDNTIGAMLGATRQQVINLRKCARERLARRLARR